VNYVELLSLDFIELPAI